MFVHLDYGIKLKREDFYLNLERQTQPKKLSLNAKSDIYEFFYIMSSNKSISISYSKQLADSQKIECYTFSSLTIGFCDEAFITITSTKDKYNILEDNTLMLIDALNKESRVNFTHAIDTFIADEYIFYLSVSENKFNWISPIEELQSGFIANLSYKGSKIGDLVINEIKRLPQRDKFNLYKVGINFFKDFKLIKNINFFYDIDLVYVSTDNYIVYKDIKNHNIKLETGFKFLYEDLIISLSGTLFQNNLFGFKDISFNQRSEHHFSSNFGTLNFGIQYSF